MTSPALLAQADGIYALYKPNGWVVHAAMERERHQDAHPVAASPAADLVARHAPHSSGSVTMPSLSTPACFTAAMICTTSP